MQHRVPGLLLIVAFLVVLSTCSSYPPISPASDALPAGVTVTHGKRSIEISTAVSPDGAGLIFYPGGLVEPEAYISMLAPIAEAGHPVIIARMPLDLAVFAPGRAEGILMRADLDALASTWVLAGHSLGGAMAARFVAREGGRYPAVLGLVLLGAYPAGSDSLVDRGYPILSIWGSEDGLATEAKRNDTTSLLPADARIVVIDGGNHSGFGEYGPQDGDGQRLISLDEQHRKVQELVIEFLNGVR